MDLAARNEDYAEAERLSKLLREAEFANPAAALQRRQQHQVKLQEETALGAGESVETRVGAVQSLSSMASPPPFCGAEEALHKVLRESNLAGNEAIQDAAENSLWRI